MVGHRVCEVTCKLVGDLTVQLAELVPRWLILEQVFGIIMVDNVFCLTK